jgi:hypothetical protein
MSSDAEPSSASAHLKQHRGDADTGRRRSPERVEMFYGARRDVPNLRRPGYLPLGIPALQLRILQLVARADPLSRDPVAVLERVEHELGHVVILQRRLSARQYDS